MKHCPKTLEQAAWYANGTLASDARRRFEDHLAGCPECQAAVALDNRLTGTLQVTAANVLPAPQTAWQKLEARLDATKPATAAEAPAETRDNPRRRPRRLPLVYFALAAQAAALVLLAGLLWVAIQQPAVQSFRTLGSQDETLVSSKPLVRVVFPAGYDYGEATGVAESAGAELQGRFEGTDIYTLAVPVLAGEQRADKVAVVLDKLRRHPDVLMAEPITDPDTPDPEL